MIINVLSDTVVDGKIVLGILRSLSHHQLSYLSDERQVRGESPHTLLRCPPHAPIRCRDFPEQAALP